MHAAVLFLWLLLLALFAATSVEGKSMWGSKRKRERERDEQREQVEVQAGGGFEASRRAAAAAALNRAGSGGGGGGGGQGLGSAQFGDQLKTLIEAYVQIVEQAIDSPDFASTVTPETIRTMLDQVPGLASNPQIAAVIESPEFTDPDKLLETVRTGIATLKTYVGDIVDMLNSPEQMSAMVDQLPPQYQSLVRRLIEGDTTALEELADSAPNINPQAKAMLKQLLSGDVSGVLEASKAMLREARAGAGGAAGGAGGGAAGASSQIEQARQMLLNNPEMLASMGLDIAVVSDEKQFAALMEESLDQLMGAMGGGGGGGGEEGAAGEEDDEGLAAGLGKLFGSAEAA